MIVVPEDTQNPIDHLTQALTELQLYEGELKKIHSDFDTAKSQLAQKEKQLQALVIKAENVIKDLHVSTHENKDLKAKLKGNMSLLEARQLVWDEII